MSMKHSAWKICMQCPCWLFYITVYDRRFIDYLHLLNMIWSKSGDNKRAEWCLESILLK